MLGDSETDSSIPAMVSPFPLLVVGLGMVTRCNLLYKERAWPSSFGFGLCQVMLELLFKTLSEKPRAYRKANSEFWHSQATEISSRINPPQKFL